MSLTRSAFDTAVCWDRAIGSQQALCEPRGDLMPKNSTARESELVFVDSTKEFSALLHRADKLTPLQEGAQPSGGSC